MTQKEPSLEKQTLQRQTLPLEGTPAAEGGAFDILAISAGEGNGWQFSPAVLKAAVPLFDQAQCYIDHLSRKADGGHSVRDLAGILTDPIWDEAVQGVRCRLTPLGPAAELLRETGRQLLADDGTAARVGFSADLSFTCQGKQVIEIQKIFSVDLVTEPARGGAFLKALRTLQQRQSAQPEPVPLQSAREWLGQNASDDTAVYGCLLEVSLATSTLPPQLQSAIRVQFENRVFDPKTLSRVIADNRALVNSLIGGKAVTGLSPAVSGMVSGEDQITAAVHDLLGVRRPQELGAVRTAKLSGIRELYTLMTGDYEFHGGFNAERAQFSLSSDLPGILKNALNKLVAQRWEELGKSGYRWWEPLVTVEHFNSLQPITGILVGEISLLPTVNEGAAYTELGVTDSAESGSWSKYGGYLGLTIEMFERDDTLRLRQFPFKLATAGLRRLSALIGAVFADSAGAGPKMADGKNVFDLAAHANLGSTALSGDSWEAASAAIYHQPLLVKNGGSAPIQAIDARYLVVPRALRLAAQRILYPALAWEANFTSENQQRGQFGDVITCPEFSDPNDWAAVADPALAPAIYVGERFGLLPEIYIADNQNNGALFTNDEVRIKARHFLSVFVADHRPLYKANVANA